MKIAILCDTHFGYKNSSKYFMNYQLKFFDNVFFPYCIKHKIRNVIHLGDLLDNRRYISIRTLQFLREIFLEKLYKHNIHLDIIPGNHDTYFRNTSDLSSLTETLRHYNDSVTLYMKPTSIQYDNLKIGLVPWINNSNYDMSMDFIEKSNCDFLAGHFEVAGFKYIGNSNIKSEGKNISLFSKYDLVISGHYHTRGISKNVQYLGSQYEFNWSDVDDDKFFYILDTNTRDLKPIKNPHKFFIRFYYNDSNPKDIEDFINNISDYDILEKNIRVIVEKKNDLYLFDQYINSINNMNPFDLNIIENFEINNDDFDNDEMIEDTPSLIDSYIDKSLVTQLDKEKIKTILQKLFLEASMLNTMK